MSKAIMAAEDKKWERESDARTLAEAEQIKADRRRLSGAKKQAKVMAKEKEKEAKAMKKVARKTKPASKKKKK